MSSLDPQTGQQPDLKKLFEKVTTSNGYCWTVLILAIAAAIGAFYVHRGVPYSDKFFLLLAVIAIAIIVNVNQLYKNYGKKNPTSKK